MQKEENETSVEVNNVILDRMLFATAMAGYRYVRIAYKHGLSTGRALAGCRRVLKAIANSCYKDKSFPHPELLVGIPPVLLHCPDIAMARKNRGYWISKIPYYDGTDTLNSEKDVFVSNVVSKQQKRKSTRYEVVIKILNGTSFRELAEEENVSRSSIHLTYHTVIRHLHYTLNEKDDYPYKGNPLYRARTCCMRRGMTESLKVQRLHKDFWLAVIDRIVKKTAV